MKKALLAVAALLALGAGAFARAETQSVDEILATIAMLEDTRVPDGRQVSAYMADSFSAPVRRRAARALARLQDSTQVQALGERLRTDPDSSVRSEAAFALGQCGSRQAYGDLLWAFGDDAVPSVRAAAVEAMGKIGDPRGVSACARALAHEDAEVRREGAIALWRLGSPTALPSLLRALRDPYPENRAMVVWALEKIVEPGKIIPELVKIQGEGSTLIRSYVARTLGRQGSPLALPPLFKLIDDPDLNVRVNAVRSLGLIADSTAAPQLLGKLEDTHPYVREVAVTALGKLRDPALAERLDDLRKDKDPGVRAALPEALVALLPADRAWKALEPLLEDKSERVRARALASLGKVNRPEAVALLRKTLATASAAPGASGVSSLERAAAADALGELKAGEAKVDLTAALADRDPGLAASAAEALGTLGDGGDEVVDALVRAVRANATPNEPDVAVSGLNALAKLKARAGVPLAESMLAASQPVVRDAARGLLVAVLGDSAVQNRLRWASTRKWKGVSTVPYRNVQPTATAAVLKTARGEIEIRFYQADAPLTVSNFVKLAQKGYFDRTRFHRVVPNFVIQDGDPTGTGWGGPGYAIRCEYNRRRYDAGAVGMALSGKDTGGSQYFITQSPQPHLDGRYTIFGHVTRGMELLNDIRLDDAIEKVTVR